VTCLLALLLACSSSPTPETSKTSTTVAPTPVPPGKLRNAVVIVVDTLRADAVDRARTPALDGLAATGAQRAWAWAPSTWTAPSVVSLFSGMHVRQHGWDFPFPSKMDLANKSYPPLPDVPVLAEVLQDAGFATTGLYANRLLARELGFGRGFRRWDQLPDARLVAAARRSIKHWKPDGRAFLYLHLMGPHHPLEPKLRSREHWNLGEGELGGEQSIGLPEVRQGGDLEEGLYWRAYHAVVEDTDAHIGDIVDALRPHLDDTLLIVTADHGELLGEHGDFGHGGGVFEPLTRVPFIVVNGPLLPDRVQTAALSDIVTGALGVDHSWPVRLGDGDELVSQREGAVALTVDGRSKAVWDSTRFDGPVQFDLVVDPAEERPQPLTDSALSAARQAFDARVPAGELSAETGATDASTLQALKALGYVGE